MTPGNLIASHEHAFAVIQLSFLASIAIPFLLAWRRGWRTAAVATAIWVTIGIVVLIVTDGLSIVDVIGIALVVLTIPWLIGLLAGAALRKARKPKPPATGGMTAGL